MRDRVVALGPCRIPGLLLDLGAYPGLVDGAGEVAGDLLRLKDADAGRLLDAFEDFDPSAPATSEYVRRRVRLVAPKVWAWVYAWNGDAEGRATVAGGDWLMRG